MIEIESGVPVPAGAGVPNRPKIYPIPYLDVGQSFFVPQEDPIKRKAITNSIGATASRHARLSPGKKFTTRLVDGGVRCWRIA